MKLKIFSFFSGCGFLDLGFEKAGYRIASVNEFSPVFLHAYQYAREKMHMEKPLYGYFNTDVNEFNTVRSTKHSSYMDNARSDGSLVGFIGGPPCPDFSVAGKQRGRDGDNGKLSLSYVNLIIRHQPDFFLFENVKGLWKTAKHRAYYDELKGMLSDAGYLMTDRLTNALEFGVPQDRDRILLFGARKEIAEKYHYNVNAFPWTKHMKYSMEEIRKIPWPSEDPFIEDGVREKPDGVPEELTVQYWFDRNDVLNHPNGAMFLTPKAGLEKMKRIPEGDDGKKSYKRLHRWRYSPTASYGNNEVHLHPYKARRLSVAECLAVQSLPKEFCIPLDMTLTAAFKTIGNGVPFLLAEGIAETIKDFLTENK